MAATKIDLNNLSHFKRSPKYPFGIKRDEKEKPKAGPGPFQYDTSRLEVTKYARSPTTAFGTAPEAKEPKSAKMPAPGAYDVAKGVEAGLLKTPTYTMRTPLQKLKTMKVPGPGAYTPQSEMQKEPGRSYSMPGPFRPPKGVNPPGPGAYQWTDPEGIGNCGQKVSLGGLSKERKRPKVPDPGSHAVKLGTLNNHPSYKVGPSWNFTSRPVAKPKVDKRDFAPLASTF